MNNGTPSRRPASQGRRVSTPHSSSGEPLDDGGLQQPNQLQPPHHHPPNHHRLRPDEPEIEEDRRSRASVYDSIRSPDDIDEDTARVLRDECEKLVRDFNVKVAIYREKLISIADFGDCSQIRHEVRRYRRKCLEAAKVAKTKLYPQMRGCKTRPEFERLFIQLTGCMEMYVNEMIKSLILLQIFPLDALRVPGVVENSDAPPKVSWSRGKSTPAPGQGSDCRLKGDWAISDHMEDSVVIEAPITNKDDLEQVCVDIRNVQSMLREVDQNELLPRQRTPDGSAFITDVLPVSGVGKMRRRLIWCCCSRPL